MNTLDRALSKVREAAAPHPYDTRARTAVLDEAEARELSQHIEWLRVERCKALELLSEVEGP